MNKPQPPPSNLTSTNNTSTGRANIPHPLISTTPCSNDSQQPSTPSAHSTKSHTSIGNDSKSLPSAAISSTSPSAIYLDTYLANNISNKQRTTLTPAPPLLPTVHDRPTAKTHVSTSRRPSHKTPHRNLSKSLPASLPYPPRAAHSPTPTTSMDKKFSEFNHQQLSTIGSNLNLTTQNNTAVPILPILTPSSTSNFTDLTGSNYATTSNSTTTTKRSRASNLKSSNELKHSKSTYVPNNGNNILTNTLHQSSEITSANVMAHSLAQPDHNSPVGIPRNNTTAESAPALNSSFHNNNNSNNNSVKPDNNINGHRMTSNVDYLPYGNFNPYFAYATGIPVHGYYTTNPQIPNDASMTAPESIYHQRAEAHVNFDPTTEITPGHPTINPSSDHLYSNLYLYSFNNNIYSSNNNNNNNNNSTTYARSTPPAPDNTNSTYNSLYSYNNLYLNNMYGYPTYPTRQYPTPSYHTHKSASVYDHQTYRNSSDEVYDDDEDYRVERSHTRSHSKRSKRRSADDDDYRKPSRKSKSRRSKRNKPLPTNEEVSVHESTELNTTHFTSLDLPKGEGPSPAAFTPPLSPAHNTKRTRASANLFENTPKIKIGEPQGGNTRISKLGRKLLDVVHLDWHTPYAQGDRAVSYHKWKGGRGVVSVHK